MSEDYYITNLDMLLLANHFNLPLVLAASLKLKENDKTFLIINKNSDENYYFVLIQPTKFGEIPQYRLFTYNSDPKININQVNMPLQTDIKIATVFDIDNYINEFKVRVPKGTTKIKIMPSKSKDKKDDDVDEEELLAALERIEEVSEKPMIRKVASQ